MRKPEFLWLLLLVPALAWAQQDVTPPALQALSLSPDAVDVTSQAATITVTANVTDDLSGLMYGYIVFQSPSGSQVTGVSFVGEPVSGTPQNGVWTAAMPFAKNTEPGAWTALSVTLVDNAGNTEVLWPSDLAAAGLPNTVTVNSNPVAGPSLTGLNISPNQVDVTGGAATLTVTAQIRDSAGGVTSAAANFRSPSGQQTGSASFVAVAAASTADTPGTYNASYDVPQHSESGTWSVDSITIQDAAGNNVKYSSGDLAAMGFTATFTVASDQDLSPPAVADFSISPLTVDTSSFAQGVTVTMRVKDNSSGFQSGYVVFGNDAGQMAAAGFLPPARTGTVWDGYYDSLVQLPAHAAEGDWVVSYVSVSDAAGNTAYVTGDELAVQGFNIRFTNTPVSAPQSMGARKQPARRK